MCPEGGDPGVLGWHDRGGESSALVVTGVRHWAGRVCRSAGWGILVVPGMRLTWSLLSAFPDVSEVIMRSALHPDRTVRSRASGHA
jgi:hypothetical protein